MNNWNLIVNNTMYTILNNKKIIVLQISYVSRERTLHINGKYSCRKLTLNYIALNIAFLCTSITIYLLLLLVTNTD